MRYLFFTLLGFFGPALVMLFLRLLWQRLRQRLFAPQQQVEIIDITPNKHQPSRLFIAIWLAVSVACTGLLIWQMDDQPAAETSYIPAHIDAQGQFVPAKTLPTAEAANNPSNDIVE